MIKSAEEFVKLRTSEQIVEYERAAYEEADVAVWLEVIQNYPEMKVWVVHNKTVPLSILEILAKDESETVREWVAAKRKLSFDLFLVLSADKSVAVRYAIAKNPKVPRSVLHKLLNDSDTWLREQVEDIIARTSA